MCCNWSASGKLFLQLTFQNPLVECDISKCISNGIHVARRESGGGAVFQVKCPHFNFQIGPRKHKLHNLLPKS